MRKVVYNTCYGGFGLSKLAVERGKEISNDPNWTFYNLPRHDPTLVQVVEELGKDANDSFSKLRIAIVEGQYRIDEYDGLETVGTRDSYDWH